MYFYNRISLKDSFETRIYLMFMHFSIILIVFKFKKIEFPQYSYDNLFACVENNLRELGFGDVGVNKKMKELNKIFYDILLKILPDNKKIKINKKLILKYFDYIKESDNQKYDLFDQYLTNFYHFCFELHPKNMIKDALKFRI